MKNMSFSATTEQIRNRTKTVTRRLGWWYLKPGQMVRAVEKCQGLKKGEKVKPLAVIRIISIRLERLDEITEADLVLEGLPNVSLPAFLNMFTRINRCYWHSKIHRIEFEYVNE